MKAVIRPLKWVDLFKGLRYWRTQGLVLWLQINFSDFVGDILCALMWLCIVCVCVLAESGVCEGFWRDTPFSAAPCCSVHRNIFSYNSLFMFLYWLSCPCPRGAGFPRGLSSCQHSSNTCSLQLFPSPVPLLSPFIVSCLITSHLYFNLSLRPDSVFCYPSWSFICYLKLHTHARYKHHHQVSLLLVQCCQGLGF